MDVEVGFGIERSVAGRGEHLAREMGVTLVWIANQAAQFVRLGKAVFY